MLKTRLLAVLLILSMFATSGVAAAQDAPFTIQADEALRPGIDVLYAAMFDGAQPTYVDAGADLLVTSDGASLDAATDTLPDYFVPDGGMVALTESADAASFIDFAVSAEGQQVLIDNGLLPDSVTITDQVGNTIVIPQPVYKVITPHSIATYTVYGVGGVDRLVAGAYLGARDEPGYSRMVQMDPGFPERNSSSMTQKEINVEEVALINPDVILTSSRSKWLDAVAELDIPVVLFQGETPELLKQAVLIVGQILGPNTAAHAEAWVEYYDRIFTTVTDATASLESRPSVLVTGSTPLTVASGEMYQTFEVDAAGGQSVSSDLAGFWNEVNLEQVAVWNPDIILVVPYEGTTVDDFNTPEWQVVKAVQNGNVFRMPSYVAPWDTPIPESILGIIWMTEALYPGLLDLDCAAETDYFYRSFYNYVLPEAEITALCGS